MTDNKNSKMNRLALFVFIALTLMGGTATSVKAQNSTDKTDVWVFEASGNKGNTAVISQATSDSQTCSMPGAYNGVQAMFIFLKSNIHYSPEAIQAKIQGDVAIFFTLTKDGTVANSRITKSLCPDLDKEVLEAVKSMPAAEFVEKDRPEVDMDYKITMNFALPDGLSLTEPTVSIAEVETEKLKMSVMKCKKREKENEAMIIIDGAPVEKDTILTKTVITITRD